LSENGVIFFEASSKCLRKNSVRERKCRPIKGEETLKERTHTGVWIYELSLAEMGLTAWVIAKYWGERESGNILRTQKDEKKKKGTSEIMGGSGMGVVKTYH